MAYSDQGFQALENGETGKARKFFRRALKLAPELPSAHLGMGNLAVTEGRYADAAAAYDSERRGYRDQVPAAVDFRLGNALARSGQNAAAIDAFDRSLASSPDFADAHYNLALVYLEEGRVADALESMARAEELGYQVNPAFLARIDVHSREEQLSTGPTGGEPRLDREAINERVSRAFGDGDYPEALSIIDESVTAAPDDADLLALRAYTLALLGEPTRAENDLLRAVELRPGWFETEYQLGLLYRALERPDDAVRWLLSAATRTVDRAHRARVLLIVGDIEHDAGKIGEAIETFERAAQADPTLKAMIAARLAE